MRILRSTFTFFLIFVLNFLFSQRIENKTMDEYISCTTIGFLQGGGSLIGVDVEFLIKDNFGIQFGAGYVGYGAAINYHFKPSLKSSFISFQYLHQGFQDSYTQSIIGPSFVFRAKKLISIQLGYGFKIENGPAIAEKDKKNMFLLTYSIGFHILR